jgi:hypothetical protein
MDRDAKAGESAEAEIDRQTYRKLPFQRQVISRRRHVQQVCAPRCTIALGLLVLTCCPAAPRARFHFLEVFIGLFLLASACFDYLYRDDYVYLFVLPQSIMYFAIGFQFIGLNVSED